MTASGRAIGYSIARTRGVHGGGPRRTSCPSGLPATRSPTARWLAGVKDGPWIVHGGERDQPPPSRRPLGGEGDVSGEPLADAGFALGVAATTASALNAIPTTYITAAGGIQPSFTFPWMRVSGSNAAVTVTAVPAIARGQQNQVLTLQCVDSAVTLSHGSANAINFMDSRASLQMTSGLIVTFFFNTANQAWNEVSRGR